MALGGGMGYLLPEEYAAYGLTAETADAWVVAAGAMIEAFCRRPSLSTQSYVERLRVGRSGHSVRLSYGPLLSLTSVRARITNVRGTRWSLFGDEVLRAFCGVGTWTVMDVTTLEADSVGGEVRLPWNLLDVSYDEVEVTYTAGFAEVPVGVKVACAQIVKNAQATPGLNVKSSRVDTLQMQYFSDSLIDSQVRALLRPYVAERMS